MKRKNNKPKVYNKALIYCRVSSERQVKEGNGLDSQEQRCIKRAAELGLEVKKIFRDEGVSGGLFDRPAMKDLMQYLDDYSHENFYVIFDDLKRFARNLQVHIKLKMELASRNAKLECLNFKFDDTPEGEFIENIMAATGQLEKDQNRRQVIQKMKARLEAGYWPFCPPPGLRNVKKILTADQPLARIYKSAIEMYRDHSLNTLEEVRSYILSQYAIFGIKRPLSLSGTVNILSELLYTGYLEYPKPGWDINLMKGQHEGFITYETYLAVQKKMHDRSKPRLRKDYSEDFPLRGFLVCDSCRKPMTASWHKGKSGKKYPHYWCKTDGCLLKNKTVMREKVEDEFMGILNNIRPNEGLRQVLHSILNDVWSNKYDHETASLKAKSKEAEQLQDEVQRLTQKIVQLENQLVIKEIERQIESLLNKKAAIEAESSQRRYTEDKFRIASSLVMESLQDPLELWGSPHYSDKRLVLNMYFETRLPYHVREGFGTPETPIVIRLLSAQEPSKDYLVGNPKLY